MELLDYDPETGVFTRRHARGNRRAGQPSGCRNSNGYVLICLDGVPGFAAHRLAWFYMTEAWPSGEVDHVNGVRDDNRFANLRDVTRSGNAQNLRKACKTNKSSGLLGSSWHAAANKWVASIHYDGKKHLIGFFDTAEAAHAAYLEAKARHHPHQTVVAQKESRPEAACHERDSGVSAARTLR